jgi:hypothetical protein
MASDKDSPRRWISVSTRRLRSCESDESSRIGVPSISDSARSRAIVLISPLWPSTEKGCTRMKDGQVLVE